MQMFSGPGFATQSGVLGAAMASGAGYARDSGVLGAVESAGPGRSYRDGIFSNATPGAAFQQFSQTAYADGMLGEDAILPGLKSLTPTASTTTKTVAYVGVGLLALGGIYLAYKALA